MKPPKICLEEVERLYQDASCGNVDAFNFILAWQNYCHGIDDLIDGDLPSKRDQIGLFFKAGALYNSNYWKIYGTQLYILMALITCDYADSETPNMPQADFLRSTGNNMVKAVALIQGGYTLLESISQRLNILSFNEHHNTETGEGD